MRTVADRTLVTSRTLWRPGDPRWDNSPDKVWWQGNTVATRGTTVTVTGSQTITEVADDSPRVSVTSIASISANDCNCVLFPALIAVGQRWRAWVRVQTSSDNQFLMGFLLMTDGTTSAANLAANMLYYNTNGTFISQGVGGTLTSISLITGATSLGGGALKRAGFILELEYVSANTWSQRVFGADGVTSIFEQTSWSQALTPTHIGIGWSNWGGSPNTPSVHFGPLYRVA